MQFHFLCYFHIYCIVLYCMKPLEDLTLFECGSELKETKEDYLKDKLIYLISVLEVSYFE